MEIKIERNSIHEMDTDQKGEIALTKKNVDFINGILNGVKDSLPPGSKNTPPQKK